MRNVLTGPESWPILSFVMDLEAIFLRLNQEHFDGCLDIPVLKWNSRLRSSAGRFVPGRRKFIREVPPVIEVATYLLEEKGAEAHVVDTMAHEMIHYWLWVRRQPYGHTPEFYVKMKLMGASRYNPVPRTRPYKYLYKCPHCDKRFPARRRLGRLACALCCKAFANGRFDSRFLLILEGSGTTWQDPRP